jgi:hypothetical protein
MKAVAAPDFCSFCRRDWSGLAYAFVGAGDVAICSTCICQAVCEMAAVLDFPKPVVIEGDGVSVEDRKADRPSGVVARPSAGEAEGHQQ